MNVCHLLIDLSVRQRVWSERDLLGSGVGRATDFDNFETVISG